MRLIHEYDHSLSIACGSTELLRYVYRPDEPQLESPRPYLHPLRTLDGRLVSLYRPHDHVWHKGIAWSLPNVGTENFWGGTTYRRDRGYEQLDNNGAMVHRGFASIDTSDKGIDVVEHLDWVTRSGDVWFTEVRSLGVGLTADAWVLTWSTAFTNVSGRPVTIGSPTTEGRDNAGYGGLFWRGPRSFTGGTVRMAGVQGGDELMGRRGRWMGFTGRFDGTGEHATIVFVDHADNGREPTKWFVRSTPFACVCPAPYFDVEKEIEDGRTTTLRYAVAIAGGDLGAEHTEILAADALTVLSGENS